MFVIRKYQAYSDVSKHFEKDENEINTQLKVLIECMDDSELKKQCKTHIHY